MNSLWTDWAILGVAILAEVVATTALKLSQGFSRWRPSVVVVCSFSLALYLLSLTLDRLPVGVVYAVWSGTGVALVALVGHRFFGQRLDRPALVGVGLIIAGVVLLQTVARH